MSDEEETEVKENEIDTHEAEEVDTEQQEPDYSPVNPDDFTTLELTLTEARRQYDDEERRRESVESKIGIVVTADALIVSFGAALNQTIPLVSLVLALLPALCSAGYGLYTIRSQEYKRPGKEILNFHDYSKYDSIPKQQEQLLLDYERTADDNREKNDIKYDAFNVCGFLTSLSLFLVLLVIIRANTSFLDCFCSHLPI